MPDKYPPPITKAVTTAQTLTCVSGVSVTTHYLHTKCQRPRKQCASELQTVNFFLHDYIDGYALYAVSSMFIITEDLQKDY